MAWSSFSYQGQDLFVLEVLNEQRGGFFLDSGASNGVQGSNTKLLEASLGWTGICIEPNARMFAELVKNRTSICLNCCLYDTAGTVEFWKLLRSMAASLVSTIRFIWTTHDAWLIPSWRQVSRYWAPRKRRGPSDPFFSTVARHP